MSASSLPRCSGCGNERGPWRPSGAVLPSGEQVLICTTGCPVAELADAVAEHGPFPMPVGTPDSLTEILARADAATPGPWCTDDWEIYQGTEYLPGLSWWIGETCRGTSTPEQDRADATFVAAARTDVPELVAEVARLRARLAAFESLELGTPEGRVSAKCEDSSHPVWLRDLDDMRGCPWCRVAELETSTAPRLCICGHSRHAHTVPAPHSCFAFGQTCPCPTYRQLLPDEAREQLKRNIAASEARAAAASPEDPHDSPLHHRYDTPRDLPEVPR